MSAERYYRCPLCGRLVLEYSLCPHCYEVARALVILLERAADDLDEATS